MTAWFSHIPDGWGRSHLKWLAQIYAGGTPSKGNESFWRDGTIPWLNSGTVNQKFIDTPSAFITDEALKNSSARWVPKGALVVALAGQGKTKGTVAQMGIDATCNQSLAAIVPKGIQARFLFYFLEGNYRNLRSLASDDLRNGLNLDLLGSIDCPIPPPRLQAVIANVLDRETARTDALVAKYERLVELLEEKRLALVTRAVTKGLNPQAPMKSSGVEWLGEIPAHWDYGPFRRYAKRLQYGATESGERDLIGAPRYIRITDIDSSGRLRDDDPKFLPQHAAEQYMLDDGDVLFARSGATVGKAFLYSSRLGPACFAGYMIRAQLANQLDPKFLYYFSSSAAYWAYIRAAQSQATIENVNASLYGSMPLPVPPISEQRNMVSHLNRATQSIDNLIAKTREAVALTRERRSALITAAVTGCNESGNGPSSAGGDTVDNDGLAFRKADRR
jgi:type I restriction enzyme S subunit